MFKQKDNSSKPFKKKEKEKEKFSLSTCWIYGDLKITSQG
jgi:hypothetical protein